MKIIGPDELLFAVDDLAGCHQFLQDYGLKPVPLSGGRTRYEALDGTAIVTCRQDDPGLPPPLSPTATLRETVHGVVDVATLESIRNELARDREVRRAADGSLHTVDDTGFAIGFQVTRRREVAAPRAATPVNHVAVEPDRPITPRTLSHVVYFVPDSAKAERFYVERLGFRVTDRFSHVGPFMRPSGTQEHHTIFFIQTPPFMQGVEHFAFHLDSGSDVLLAGTRFANKGYQSFWGPGRHLFGSNWFWYFNSPLGCKIEYDAEMDLHDDGWQPRERPMSADNAQLFLFTPRPKWMPGGRPE